MDLKAEHEIKALHNKINLLQEQIERMRGDDIGQLTKLVRELRDRGVPQSPDRHGLPGQAGQ